MKLIISILLFSGAILLGSCSSENDANKSKNGFYKAQSSVLFPYYKKNYGRLHHLKKYTAGYMDLQGKKVIRPQFTFAEPFTEGLGCVAVYERREGVKYGYIDSTGNFAIEPQFYDARPFNEGRALVRNEDYDWGVINRKGQLIVPFKYNTRTTDYYNGYCYAYEFVNSRKTGLIIKVNREYYNCYKIDLNGNAELLEASTTKTDHGKAANHNRNNGLGMYWEGERRK